MAYGHHELIVVIGASEGAALEILDSIKAELEVNEDLAKDIPEMVHPIARLERIANHCAGQPAKPKAKLSELRRRKSGSR